jgi:hypothetical protein
LWRHPKMSRIKVLEIQTHERDFTVAFYPPLSAIILRHDARCQWEKVPVRKLKVSLVANEHWVRVTGHIGAS